MATKRYFEFKTAGKWYDGENMENGHLVTSQNYNHHLGIESIILSEPNSKKDDSVLAAVTVITPAVTFNGTIFLGKDADTLTFNVETRQWTDDKGVKQYTPVFNVKQAVVAQILRHAESRRLPVPVEWEQATQEPAAGGFDLSALSAEQQQAYLVALATAQASQASQAAPAVQEPAKASATDLPTGFIGK